MRKIVGVTACIAGLAHTYMAKTNLEKYAKKAGIDVKIEAQGSMGIENKLSQEEIDEADLVIFAVDTSVTDRDRFSEKQIFEVGTNQVIKDGEKVIKDASKMVENEKGN